MLTLRQAANAYAASSSRRNLRQQEAEVFHRVNAMLRRGREKGGLTKVRALNDNQRLWSALADLLRDPDNGLPLALRASIVSIGLAVKREIESANPDMDFLITINRNIADGLSANN
jgi:flagellar biosynthesis regulator FlaF